MSPVDGPLTLLLLLVALEAFLAVAWLLERLAGDSDERPQSGKGW